MENVEEFAEKCARAWWDHRTGDVSLRTFRAPSRRLFGACVSAGRPRATPSSGLGSNLSTAGVRCVRPAAAPAARA